MTLNVTGPERRQAERTIVDSVVYINFDSNNGGIVLNVSEGGLCFHSFAPVQRNGKIRFWFSEHKQRIEADGELAWTDETQKTGGLRFTAVPAGVRQQIRNWISQPAMRLAAEKASARSVPPPSPIPDFRATPPDTNAVPSGSVFPAVGSAERKAPSSLTGFSRGLATGLLVSALVLVPFLLHSYRRQLGESLIHLGERLATRSQTQTVSPASPNASPPLRPSSPTGGQSANSTPENVLPRAPINAAKPQQANLERSRLTTATHAVAGGPANTSPASAATISATPPRISFPTTAVAPMPNASRDEINIVPLHEPPNQPGVHDGVTRPENSGPDFAGYFEVGKFRDDLGANKMADNLRQLGLHAAVTQKGHLWINSYSVLVGPYSDHEDAEAARKDLVSYGFKPRAFERGSRNFTFPFALTLNGTQVPVGDYTISWESYIADALVKFVLNYDVVATPGAKWVKRDASYQQNAVVWRQNRDGSRSLIEIRFAGMSRALVFGS
jgi:cell division protein FtsN